MDLASLLPALPVAGWILVVLGALVVGLSKTALPGGGTIAVGLFALALPAKESTAALLLLLIVGDWTALYAYRREPDVRTLLRLIPSVLVGLVAGTLFFWLAGGDVVRTTIGVILLALVAVTVIRRRRPAKPREADGEEPAATGPGVTLARAGYGLLGGFTTMVANAGGPVMSMYFYAMRMPVLTFLGTSAWFFAVVNVLKLPFSAGLGLITSRTLVMDLVLVPVVLIGAYLGTRIARRIPQKVFETVVLVLTVVSALALLVL